MIIKIVVCLPVGTYIYRYYMIYVACFTRHSLIKITGQNLVLLEHCIIDADFAASNPSMYSNVHSKIRNVPEALQIGMLAAGTMTSAAFLGMVLWQFGQPV